MKKIQFLSLLLFFTGAIFAQDTYTIPTLTSQQKHISTLQQLWAVHSVGINYAKSHGTSPYDYGKYVGSLFAPSWDSSRGFNGFVKGVLYNLETFRVPADGEVRILNTGDNRVDIWFPTVAFSKFMPEGKYIITFDEFCDAMNGMFEPLASKMGATTVVKNKGEWLVFEISKKI